MHYLAWSISLPMAALLFLPATADAGVEPEPSEELAAGDYYRADPIPVTSEQLSDEPPPPDAAASGTLFINFDGASLKAGNDNAPSNTTQMPSQYVNFNYPAYGQGAKRDATLQAVTIDWAPFNVLVTDVRPASGPYHMCMTGPGKGGGLPNGVLGIAPLDCNDGQKSNIVYAFHSVNDQFPASTQATTISQELAHAFGLEHVNQPNDIMNPYNAGGDPAFLDQCIGIDGGGNGIVCGQQHAQYCGNGSNQNSYQELVGFFGASAPDTGPPTVAITYPNPGDQFAPGASFEVTVDASDDKGVTKVNLYTNGASSGTDSSPPYSWSVAMIPAGEYDFQAVAFDAANNQTMSAVVHVSVQAMGGSTSTSTSTTGSSDSASASASDSASGTSDSGSGTGGDPTTGGMDTDASASNGDTGSDDATATAGSALPPGYGDGVGESGCRLGGREAAGGLALLLPVLWRRRRRG
ncbi:MAG: Ig-like domain-containing protein [Myxococcales bacterium]|nr:Ig-like domain-containing protein [Myxococcales bacterium]MCB9570317.1 Ig-like domain-containing protein [Myxococcales bacterium]MCB9703151.1 Ig-like domain-containing protein [Myxococcales bacterium]